MDEESETTLCIIKECFVYRIPPRRGTQSYRAGEWDVSTFIWSGRVVVKSKGKDCVIRLEDPNTGELFAVSPVREGSVEPVVDSKRYFVLRIENGNKHAFVGMGFTDREQAFDFTSALQDHYNYVKAEKEAEENMKRLESEPKKDYSLKEGEKIHVSIKASKPGPGTPKKSEGTGILPPPSGGLLAPPPTGGRRSSGSGATGGGTSNKLDDIWSEFTSGNTQQQQQQSNSSNSNDWVYF